MNPSYRIIAVNKCDDEDDTEAIRRHIRKIRDSGELRMKSLFGNEDQMVLVSGLGGLVSEMKKADRVLSEDMRWHADRMSDSGYLDPERHGVEKLRNLIERRIIDNRGEGIIRSHQSRIANVFEEVARRLGRDDDDLRHKLDAVAASTEERKKDKSRLSRDIGELKAHAEGTKIDIINDVGRLHSTLDDGLKEVGAAVMRSVKQELSSMTRVDGLAEQAYWGIQQALYKERSTVAKHVRELMRAVETKLNNAENELSDRFMRSGFGTRMLRTHLLPVSARSICKDAEAELVAKLDQKDLPDVVRRAANWWQRIVNPAKGKKRAIEELPTHLRQGLIEALEVIPGHTERELKKLVDEAVGSMEESCRQSLERRQDQLEALEKEDASDEEVREQTNQEIAEVAERRRQAKALQNEYEAAVVG